MNTQRLLSTLVVAGALGAALLTGCGGGDDDGGVASLQSGSADPSGVADAGGKDAEQLLLDYTRCLREQGLDVPDPEFDEDGGARMMIRADRADGGGAAITPEKFEAARKVCGDPPPPTGGGEPIDRSELQDSALAFARCMRDNGIDIPDPQFSTEGGGRGELTFGGGPGASGAFDPDDPKMAAAEEKCRPIIDEARKGDR